MIKTGIVAVILFLYPLVGRCDDANSLTFKPYLGRLRTVEASIHNRSYPFLFDTGGGLTIITPAVAKEIGCAPWGRIIAHRMDGQTVPFQRCGSADIGLNGMIVNTEVFVFDLMALLPKDVPPLGGILSLHTFMNHAITINLLQNQ
ncbi:MAG TPA: hypothetical protein VJ521_09035, partial [Acidobacteriota bacterium]|nr:hypothetical protein [Acidobacteriota bacterium]